MKQIFFTTIFLIVHIELSGQSDVALIVNSYKNLDSTLYTEKVLKEIQKEIINNYFIEFKNKPNKKTSDYEIIEIIENKLNKVINDINNSKLLFVLDFDIDTAKIKTNDYFVVNPHYFKFNLFCFDKKKYPFKYVLFYDGELDSYSTFPTFSRKYLKHVQHAFKVVLRRKPQYLLFCWSLPNSVVYVLNNKIYVYRVIQRKIYELDEYVKLFSHTIRKGY